MSRRAILTAVAALALTVPAAGAFADTGGVSGGPGYHPNGNSCDAGHGAFGYFGGKYNNLGVNDLGSNGAPGAANPHAPSDGLTTGGVNSAASAACNGN